MRGFPRNSTVFIKLYRLPTTGDRKYPDTPTWTGEGNFIQAERPADKSEGGLFVVENCLFVEFTTDIRATDKIDINGTMYFVKKVNPLSYVHRPYKQAWVEAET